MAVREATMKEIRKKIEKLRSEIRRHDHLYYVLSQPVISDKEYDDLMRQLQELEAEHPGYGSVDSPTARVAGGVARGFKTLRHQARMLSLENAYSEQELREWEQRVRKVLGKDKVEFVVEQKIDGVSASLRYRKGRLAAAATRGDGETGEDVTRNIRTIRSVPLVLLGEKAVDSIEIRGEVFMERPAFKRLNAERQKQGEELFANPRNAASGSLKLLDSSLVRARPLDFYGHSLGALEGVSVRTQWDFLNKLREWGIRASPQARLCKDLEEVISYYKYWAGRRDTISYEVDGVVVKVNSLKQQQRLGWTLKNPRWAVAYKFPARQATTEVTGIRVNVGRTGALTPTAELKPAECAGVIIRHVTLHNFDEVRRLGIKVGDRVLIERAGDVIPKVVKVVADRGGQVLLLPKECPVCGGKVLKEKEEDVAYRCINPACAAQLERELLHFASRSCMDIEGMGESVVSQLVAGGAGKPVRTVADIYRLRADDLARLDLFKEKKIQNLLAAIERSKGRPLSRLVYALGIRHVGEKAAYVLACHFKDMHTLMAASRSELEQIKEIGPVMAASIRAYFSQSTTRELIKKLEAEGLTFTQAVSRPLRSTALSGRTVVFTGELRGFTRSQAQQAARDAGARVVSGVSARTDFVIAGESPGSKLREARKLNVKIVDESEFKEMIS